VIQKCLGLALISASMLIAQPGDRPETVAVHDGAITLPALLWRPPGRGPFPAVMFNHGSGRTPEELQRLGPYEEQAEALGPVFARHGYLFLFREGVGLSAGQGSSAIDLMNRSSRRTGKMGGTRCNSGYWRIGN